MEVRPDRDNERASADTDEGEREGWCVGIVGLFHAPHEDHLFAVRTGLCTVLDEAEVLKELHEPLLARRGREDRHVHFFGVLSERVIEDDFEESLAQLEPVHLDLERADLQSSFGLESRLDVAILICPLDFEVEEGDEIIPLVAHVRNLVCLAREPLVESGPAVVLPEAVEELRRDVGPRRTPSS